MLVNREIAVGMLNTDAIAMAHAPCGKDNGAIQSGIDDLVAIGDDVDAKMSVIGIETINHRAINGDKEILNQRTWLGGRQIVGAKEVVLVLGLVFGAKDAVLF